MLITLYYKVVRTFILVKIAVSRPQAHFLDWYIPRHVAGSKAPQGTASAAVSSRKGMVRRLLASDTYLTVAIDVQPSTRTGETKVDRETSW